MKGVWGCPPPGPGDTTAAWWESQAVAICRHPDLWTGTFVGWFFPIPAPMLKLHDKIENMTV